MHRIPRRSLLALAAGLALLPAAFAQGPEAWPAKPVRILVPYAPGGAVDVVTRKMAQKLSEQTGQSFVVENRAGATGTIGAQQVAKADADGYTLMANDITWSLLPHIFRKLPFDHAADLQPVGAFVFAPMALAVHAGSRFKTLQELVAEGRAQPNKVT
jgi:tripartite-type tricarboxylate transporter receptor subunit TctC